MTLSNNMSHIPSLNSLPTLLLLEGPKFPSFDFKISSLSNRSKSFKIKDQTIYLYPDNDTNELFMNDGNDEHTVKTANNVWDAVRFFFN
jgi:hypothetical protein